MGEAEFARHEGTGIRVRQQAGPALRRLLTLLRLRRRTKV